MHDYLNYIGVCWYWSLSKYLQLSNIQLTLVTLFTLSDTVFFSKVLCSCLLILLILHAASLFI